LSFSFGNRPPTGDRHDKATVVSLVPMVPMATVMTKQPLFHWRPWCHWQPSYQSNRCFTGAMVPMATVMSKQPLFHWCQWQPSCLSIRCFTGAMVPMATVMSKQLLFHWRPWCQWQPSCQSTRCFTCAHGANGNRPVKATVVSLVPVVPMATVMSKQLLFHWRPRLQWQPSVHC